MFRPTTTETAELITEINGNDMNEQLTRSDIRTMARKAADYITFNCDGVSEGFEITHKGYTVFVDYSARLCNDEMSEYGTGRAGSVRRLPKPCN